MDRDVPRADVVLEAVEDHPAVHVGQADVQRDGVRLVLAAPGPGPRRRRGDQPLKPCSRGQVEQDAGEPGSFSTISSTRSPGPMVSRSSPPIVD